MILTWILAIATLGSFSIGLYQVIKSKKGKALAWLLATLAMCVCFGFVLWGYLKQEAENRALTDPQLRAERLVRDWSYEEERNFDFISRGDAEGIVAAAADLMEDLKECRPEAFAAAQERMQEARERSEEARAIPTNYPSDTWSAEHEIWTEAAAAAYGQVKGVSITPPDCGGRL